MSRIFSAVGEESTLAVKIAEARGRNAAVEELLTEVELLSDEQAQHLVVGRELEKT